MNKDELIEAIATAHCGVDGGNWEEDKWGYRATAEEIINAALIAKAEKMTPDSETASEYETWQWVDLVLSLADALEKAEAKAAAWDELRSEVSRMTSADVGRSRIVYASEMDERLAKHQSGESK